MVRETHCLPPSVATHCQLPSILLPGWSMGNWNELPVSITGAAGGLGEEPSLGAAVPALSLGVAQEDSQQRTRRRPASTTCPETLSHSALGCEWDPGLTPSAVLAHCHLSPLLRMPAQQGADNQGSSVREEPPPSLVRLLSCIPPRCPGLDLYHGLPGRTCFSALSGAGVGLAGGGLVPGRVLGSQAWRLLPTSGPAKAEDRAKARGGQTTPEAVSPSRP